MISDIKRALISLAAIGVSDIGHAYVINISTKYVYILMII